MSQAVSILENLCGFSDFGLKKSSKLQIDRSRRLERIVWCNFTEEKLLPPVLSTFSKILCGFLYFGLLTLSKFRSILKNYKYDNSIRKHCWLQVYSKFRKCGGFSLFWSFICPNVRISKILSLFLYQQKCLHKII